MSGAEEIEKIKLAVVDFLAVGNIKGAVGYVRGIAPMLGLKGAMEFVNKVQTEVDPTPLTAEQNRQITQKAKSL